MKKLTTALLAAGFVLSASACASPQLTTAETCDRIKIVVSNPTNSRGQDRNDAPCQPDPSDRGRVLG